MAYYKVLKAFVTLAYLMFWKGRKASKTFLVEIEKEIQPDTLAPAQKQRLTNYITLIIMVSTWFCILRGKRINQNELNNAVYLGAFTAMVDTLNDEQKVKFAEILDALKLGILDSTEIKIVKYTYEKLKQIQNSRFFELLQQGLRAQDESIKLLAEPRLDIAEIKEISAGKGGSSMCIYRSILENVLKEEEYRITFQLGYIFQIGDDAFDVYEDYKLGLQTLITRTKNIKEVYREYTEELQEFTESSFTLKYPKRNIKDFLLATSIALTRIDVCFAQLIQLQESNNNIFDISIHKRKDLICDMEKPANLFASFMQSVRFYKDIEKKYA